MKDLVKQYRKEIRNILLLALLVAAIPYLPQVLRFTASFTDIMVCMGLLCGYILGMCIKVYYRIVVIRIRQEHASRA